MNQVGPAISLLTPSPLTLLHFSICHQIHNFSLPSFFLSSVFSDIYYVVHRCKDKTDQTHTNWNLFPFLHFYIFTTNLHMNSLRLWCHEGTCLRRQNFRHMDVGVSTWHIHYRRRATKRLSSSFVFKATDTKRIECWINVYMMVWNNSWSPLYMAHSVSHFLQIPCDLF